MKKLAIIMTSLLAALGSVQACFAQTGGISGTYVYDGEAIDGVNVSLYKVASYDGDFHYTTDYLGYEREISALTNSELGDYGKELAQVAATPLNTTQTINGDYSFSGFEEGIYLVTFEDITIGDYTYSALPIVLTMPDANENYQITLVTKSEKSCPDCVEPEPEPTPPDDSKTPNTHDQIKFYVKLFSVLIIFEMLMLLAIIKERKKEDSDENQ